VTGERPTRKISTRKISTRKTSTRKTCGMGDAKHHSLIHEDRLTGFGRAGNSPNGQVPESLVVPGHMG
jgi:hypothetical protein